MTRSTRCAATSGGHRERQTFDLRHVTRPPHRRKIPARQEGQVQVGETKLASQQIRIGLDGVLDLDPTSRPDFLGPPLGAGGRCLIGDETLRVVDDLDNRIKLGDGKHHPPQGPGPLPRTHRGEQVRFRIALGQREQDGRRLRQRLALGRSTSALCSGG